MASLLVAGIAGGLLALAFLALLPLHDRSRRRERWLEALVRENEEGLCRLVHDWDALPFAQEPAAPADHPYALDLDLFGRASVRQLLGSAGAPPGESTLRGWLLAPAAPADVRERQSAVAELAGHTNLRQELAARSRSMERVSQRRLEAFLAWTEAPAWLRARPGLVALSRVLPAVTLGLMLLHGLGMLPWAWVATLGAQILLLRRYGSEIRTRLDSASPPGAVFGTYAHLFRAVAEMPFESPLLRRLQEEMSAGGAPAHACIARLAARNQWADARFSAYHWIYNSLTLWDLHTLHALESWQRRFGGGVRRWFEALGEAEALAALATAAFERPGWTFPELVEEGRPRLEAEALGHPLLPDHARVDNDVSLGPPGTVLLITGSNMSGKSTLLRAIGVAAVLAQAGAPVCARRLRLTPLQPFSSIRISDSLAEGVSLFMAELRRLKQVVEAAERAGRDGGRAVLYLLDEILHGTNSAERHLAARRILRHLAGQHAVGAVTTHDLALADAPELSDAVRTVHFRETVHPPGEGPVMSFDYCLRPGLATTTNALRLMQAVGLDFGERPES